MDIADYGIKSHTVKALVICVSLILLMFFYIGFMRRQLQQKESIEVLQLKKKELEKLVLLHLEYTVLNIPPDAQVVDIDNRTFLWKEISQDEKLVFRFSQKNCLECVKSQIPFLIRTAQKIGTDKVVLLVSYENRREMISTLKSLNLLAMHAYNIPIDEFSKYNPDVEELDIPFAFWINRKGESSLLFFPLKEMPEVSRLYYNRIMRKE